VKQSYRASLSSLWQSLPALPHRRPCPSPKEKEQEKDPTEKLVDSGSFGVFMNGHRVARKRSP